jgi:release factor glutamine methyltransferase
LSDTTANLHEEAWPVKRLLTWTTDFLKRKGSESPRLDAEVMLAHVLGWPRVQLYTHYEDIVDDAKRKAFRELVKRRAEGAPVAYLVGRKEFYSLKFEVGPAVLIPRPESEFVVVEFLTVCKRMEAPRAVDVGTGSGCIALASLKHHPTARFVAIDVSADALALARKNAASLGLGDRIDFRQGDRLNPVAGDGPFDVILSNPPYIPTEDVAGLEPGVRDYEPHTALDGGPDGLRMVESLIEESAPLLKPGGHLILEIGSAQESAVRGLIESNGAYRLMPTVHDHAKHPRVIRATKIGE